MVKRYVIAVRREARGAVLDLARLIEGIDGVSVVGVTSAQAQVDATEEGIAFLRARLGTTCIIEELIERRIT